MIISLCQKQSLFLTIVFDIAKTSVYTKETVFKNNRIFDTILVILNDNNVLQDPGGEKKPIFMLKHNMYAKYKYFMYSFFVKKEED